MLITDMRKEIEGMIRSEFLNKSRLAERLGVSRQSINTMLIRDTWLHKSLIDLAEAMGYDIEIQFVKRK